MSTEVSTSGNQEPSLSERPITSTSIAADAINQDVNSRVASLESELRLAREKIKESETRGQIQRLLMEAQTIDVDAAMLLAEAALKEGSAAVEKLSDRAIGRVIEDIRRQKPLLFCLTPKPRPSAMGARIDRPETPIVNAAEEAARSGHRTDLLRYLHLRRANVQTPAL